MTTARIVFFGTAEIACASLEELARDPRFTLLGVVTQPDKPRGRDLRVQPSAVKAAALRLNIPVFQPNRARDPLFIDQVRALSPDLGVVIAYGQILPQSLLDLPVRGFVNVHTSLLPKYRGAAPIQAALLSGDSETGVTLMKMDAGLDTGPILALRSTPISPHETAQSLHDRLALLGAELLLDTLPRVLDGSIQERPQPPTGATYAAKIEKADGQINWDETAVLIERRIRAYTPWPAAQTVLEITGSAQVAGVSVPRLMKIWKAEVVYQSGEPGSLLQADRSALIIACGAGALRVLELQMEGRKRLSIQEFLAGHSVARVCL